MYNKIMIFGCCGCGKTTLSKEIQNVTQLPLIHLDSINWTDNWNALSPSEFDSLLVKEMQKPYWIIEGLYNRTVEARIHYCDTIIYMDFPRWFCLHNVIKRVIKNYGKSRDGMPDNCPEKFDYAFLKCIWNYNKKYRQKYLTLLKNIVDKKVFILRSQKDCKFLVQRLKKYYTH